LPWRVSWSDCRPRGARVAERWFFALWPDGATAQALAAQARRLIPVGARAVHPRDLHLTLQFLGELTSPQVRAALQAGDAVCGRAFGLAIDQTGAFRHARVLWCGPSQAPAALSELVGELGRALGAHGFTPETRPFRAHVTLARKFHGASTLDWGRAVWWPVGDLCLAHGLEGQVPRYAVTHHWPLAVAA
jgi:RNA 2',3'-cyclic 3'-phosphodiesterase